MKKNLVCTSILAIAAIFNSSFASDMPSDRTREQLPRLMLEVQSDKGRYLPGELISLRFKVINASGGPVYLYKGSDVGTGCLKIFIAFEGERYKEYRGPSWGIKDVVYEEPFLRLFPGDVFETQATILHNIPIQTSHLDEYTASEHQTV